MATIEEKLTLLETQQALQTEALRRVLEGHWLGADGAAGTVVQLMGGEQQDFAPRDFPAGGRTRLMLDRGTAPSQDQARRLQDAHGVEVWGVYVGGPFYKMNGWTRADVARLSNLGMQFLPIYVGQQTEGVLTASQGETDAVDALNCMARFGWQTDAPVCLDVEASTFDDHPTASLAYARAWVRRVRAGELRPGIYAAPRTLVALAGQQPADEERPDWVWAASNANDTLDPSLTLRRIKALPDELWSGRGQRAWQYAISVDSQRVTLQNVEVDISLTSVATRAPESA
jgi:hypothetical protein